jgi:hypothetical protein
VQVLLVGCGRGGQRERAALRVPAHGPAITGVDDRAAELADAFECRGHVGDGEVGQGGGVAGARSTLVDSKTQAVGVGLPPGSGRGRSWRKSDPKDSVPEPAGAIGIVGRKLDQRHRHEGSMTGARAHFSFMALSRSQPACSVRHGGVDWDHRLPAGVDGLDDLGVADALPVDGISVFFGRKRSDGVHLVGRQ